jgi:hypothetical protein
MNNAACTWNHLFVHVLQSLSPTARTALIPPAADRYLHGKPVHQLPSHLPPVRLRVDVYGNPACQPEPFPAARQDPVPAMQGQCSDGCEKREVTAFSPWQNCPVNKPGPFIFRHDLPGIFPFRSCTGFPWLVRDRFRSLLFTGELFHRLSVMEEPARETIFMAAPVLLSVP